MIEFFDRSKEEAEIGEARIFDTTLRDGEQTPGVSFSQTEKLEISHILDDMGTHVIEGGFPVNSDTEREIVENIVTTTSTTVASLARVVDKDIDAALDTGSEMVHVFVSTSDIQIEDSMHSTRDEVLQRSIEAVERCANAGVEVMYTPMDATRTNEKFLLDIIEAVSDAGVEWINIADTVGVATPTRFSQLIDLVAQVTDARIDVHTHDDFGLATPNAIAGLLAGAEQAQVSVNGIGERAGNASYEQVVAILESQYDVELGIDTSQISKLSRIVKYASGLEMPPNKPIVGYNTR